MLMAPSCLLSTAHEGGAVAPFVRLVRIGIAPVQQHPYNPLMPLLAA